MVTSGCSAISIAESLVSWNNVANAAMSTNPRTRSGWSATNRCATMAPIEWPTTTVLSSPMASMNACTSDGSSGNTRSNEHHESVTPWRKTTGRPSADPCSTYSIRTPVDNVTNCPIGTSLLFSCSNLLRRRPQDEPDAQVDSAR